MVTISIKADFNDVQKKINNLSDELKKKVIPAALNKLIAKANASMVKEIASEFNIKSSEIRANLEIIRANRRTDSFFAVLSPSTIGSKGRGLNLIRFVKNRPAAGSKRQLAFKIKKTGGKKSIAGAFIGNDGRTVFIRVAGKYIKNRVNVKGDSKHAEAIRALTTIDIPGMFNTKRINKRVLNRITNELPIEFDRAIKAAIAGNIR